MTPPPPENNPTSENAEAKGGVQQQQIANLESDIRKGEIWIICLTAAMAFFALCGVVVGILQWRTYTGQLGVMQGQLDQMKDTRLLGETQKLAKNAGDQVEQLRRMVTASGRQATALSGQLAVMQKQFQAADRAWIQVEASGDFDPNAFPNPGPPLFFNSAGRGQLLRQIILRNVGRTTEVDPIVWTEFRLSLDGGAG